MQLSGSMTRKFGPSWKQSTGHTSTQSVCLQLMQFSVTTWVTGRGAVGDTHSLAAPIALGHDLDQDRKSVVEGKSVSVRVDLGGRRIIKKKKIIMQVTN